MVSRSSSATDARWGEGGFERLALADSQSIFMLEGKHIPEQFKEPIRRLQRQCLLAEHEAPGEDRRDALLAGGSGRTEYLAVRSQSGEARVSSSPHR
jgi:hypothetical protein